MGRSRSVEVRRGVAGILAPLALLTLLVGCTSSDGDDDTAPNESASPTASVASGPATEDIVITRPDWPSLATKAVPPPTRDAVPLSRDPVRRATLAVTDLEGDRSIYVLGLDGTWRRVDRPRLRYEFEGPGQEWPVLSPNGLDAHGTRLAVPQDESLVVIDLITGRFRRYAVPGQNDDVAWEGRHSVLVGQDARLGSRLVDLRTGRVTDSTHRRTTRVLPDGRAVTWGGGRGNDNYYFNVMKWDDGTEVRPIANNSIGARPLVRDDVVIGLHNPTHSQLNPDLVTGDDTLDALMREFDGVAAVSGSTGDVLGFLVLSDERFEATRLLGWAGNQPVLALVKQDEHERRAYVVTWDYETGELVPLATLPTWYVAWGVGLPH